MTQTLNTKLAYSVDEAATLINIHPQTLRKLARAGKIRVKRIGSRVVIPAKALEDFLNETPAGGAGAA